MLSPPCLSGVMHSRKGLHVYIWKSGSKSNLLSILSMVSQHLNSKYITGNSESCTTEDHHLKPAQLHCRVVSTKDDAYLKS